MEVTFKELPNLVFKRKETYDDFIKNQKYIITSKQTYDSLTRVDIAIYRETEEMNNVYIEFTIHKEIERYKTNDLPNIFYYEIVSKKKEIQNAMETRALTMIIQNIIGDKCFKY